ncbi:MAG: hypothetical protein IJS66_00565 [Bacteroidales bacterium]|nr:hypothetical protein [Bacteroidales bacterium]
MKKYILFLIPAVLALWSCSKELSANKASIYYDFELEMEEPIPADVLTATDIAAIKSFYK